MNGIRNTPLIKIYSDTYILSLILSLLYALAVAKTLQIF